MRAHIRPRLLFASYFLCATILFGLVLTYLGSLENLPLTWETWLPTLVIVILFGHAFTEHDGPLPKEPSAQDTRHFRFGVAAALVALSAVIFLLWSSTNDATSLLLIALGVLVLTVSVFRVPVVCYVGAATVIGLVVGSHTLSIYFGILAGLAVLITWVILNYAAQLLLDHDAELAQYWTLGSKRKLLAALVTGYLLIPVFILVALGYSLHTELQRQLLEIAYSPALVIEGEPLIPANCHHQLSTASALESAIVDCTIPTRTKMTQETIDKWIVNSSSEAQSVLTTGPERIAAVLERMQPKQIDGRAACSGFMYKNRFVSFSFTSPCRALVEHINDVMTGTHRRTSAKIIEEINKSADRGHFAIQGNEAIVREEAQEAINEYYIELTKAVHATFTAVAIIGMLSLAVLCISLFAAFQMMLGRVLFHDPRFIRFAGTRTTDIVLVAIAIAAFSLLLGLSLSVFALMMLMSILGCLIFYRAGISEFGASMTFKLRPDKASNIEKSRTDSLLLSAGSPGPIVWYIRLSVARRGDDTAQRASIPQIGRCIFNRIFSGAYVLTRVEAHPGSSATISMAGDTKLVRVKIKEAQAVCFRMSDLVAFTSDVKLRARYNTHIGTHLLGLGTIYSVAEGSGFLVLRSEGSKVSDLQPNESTPASNLLVWDEGHAFALDQRLGMIGLWVNPPSLVSRESVNGAAILDEGAPERFPILSRIWSLIRYLFLPI